MTEFVEKARPFISGFGALAIAIPVVVIVWWFGFLLFRLVDGHIAEVNLHVGTDGFDWKMSMPEKTEGQR